MKITGTNIAMVRGDSEVIDVTLVDDQGEPVPFVDGDRIYFTVKPHANTADKSIQKIVENFTGNVATINIDPEDTKHLKFAGYVYDIQLTRADGTVKTVVGVSVFKVCEEVTYE